MIYAPTYSASKSAVITFTRCIKVIIAAAYKSPHFLELFQSTAEGANIRANCICPYYVDTEMSRRALELIPEPFKTEILNYGIMK